MQLQDGVLVDGARAALEGVLNGVWRGIVLVAVVAIAVRLLGGAGATVRHLVWLGALGAVVALTVLPITGRLADKESTVVEPYLATADLVQGMVPERPLPPIVADPPSAATSPGLTLEIPRAEWLLIIVTLLLTVSAFRLVRLAFGFNRWSRFGAWTEPLPAELLQVVEDLPAEYFRRRPVVRLSDDLSRPITMGFLRPTVLLPRTVTAILTPLELKQVVLHELAHVRRYDDWTNLIQRLLESIFYFNPVVGWIGRRLETEREIACDEQVVARLGARSGYASLLVRLAESTRPVAGSQFVTGVASNRNQLRRRVKAIVTRGEHMTRWHPALSFGAGASVLTLSLLISSNGPAVTVALAEQFQIPGSAANGESVDVLLDGSAAASPTASDAVSITASEPAPASRAGGTGTAGLAPGEGGVVRDLVSGRVTTAELAPLPGVTVTLEGTTIEALTNNTGNYALDIPSANGRLVFSLPGYATQAVSIEGRRVVDVVLQDLTAVMLQSLTEAAAGIGAPSPPVPLYVIDGVTRSADEFNRLDPTDIESISVLRAASGAAAGERAANGVVLVTTKATRQTAPVEGPRGQEVTREYMEAAAAIAPLCRSCDGASSMFYVIDGAPASLVEFNRLGPADIESISILKDAAAAVYGDAARNGVVLVKTRSGR